jgi:hypothetical protein
MSDLRIYDRNGSLRESLVAAQKRIRKEEGSELSLSQVAHRLVHLGKRSLEQRPEVGE